MEWQLENAIKIRQYFMENLSRHDIQMLEGESIVWKMHDVAYSNKFENTRK